MYSGYLGISRTCLAFQPEDAQSHILKSELAKAKGKEGRSAYILVILESETGHMGETRMGISRNPNWQNPKEREGGALLSRNLKLSAWVHLATCFTFQPEDAHCTIAN